MGGGRSAPRRRRGRSRCGRLAGDARRPRAAPWPRSPRPTRSARPCCCARPRSWWRCRPGSASSGRPRSGSALRDLFEEEEGYWWRTAAEVVRARPADAGAALGAGLRGGASAPTGWPTPPPCCAGCRRWRPARPTGWPGWRCGGTACTCTIGRASAADPALAGLAGRPAARRHRQHRHVMDGGGARRRTADHLGPGPARHRGAPRRVAQPVMPPPERPARPVARRTRGTRWPRRRRWTRRWPGSPRSWSSARTSWRRWARRSPTRPGRCPARPSCWPAGCSTTAETEEDRAALRSASAPATRRWAGGSDARRATPSGRWRASASWPSWTATATCPTSPPPCRTWAPAWPSWASNDDALSVTYEAVALHRELLEADRDRYLPALARALTNLSACLSRSGRRPAALGAAGQAVAIYRELVEMHPNAYGNELAAADHNWRICREALGQPVAGRRRRHRPARQPGRPVRPARSATPPSVGSPRGDPPAPATWPHHVQRRRHARRAHRGRARRHRRRPGARRRRAADRRAAGGRGDQPAGAVPADPDARCPMAVSRSVEDGPDRVRVRRLGGPVAQEARQGATVAGRAGSIPSRSLSRRGRRVDGGHVGPGGGRRRGPGTNGYRRARGRTRCGWPAATAT